VLIDFLTLMIVKLQRGKMLSIYSNIDLFVDLPLLRSSIRENHTNMKRFSWSRSRIQPTLFFTRERENSHYRWQANRAVSAVGTGFPKKRAPAQVSIECVCMGGEGGGDGRPRPEPLAAFLGNGLASHIDILSSFSI
jgi:hypothetical protein